MFNTILDQIGIYFVILFAFKNVLFLNESVQIM